MIDITIARQDGSSEVTVEFIDAFYFLHHICHVTPILLHAGDSLTVNWIGKATIHQESALLDEVDFHMTETYTFDAPRTFRFIEFIYSKAGKKINIYEEAPVLE